MLAFDEKQKLIRFLQARYKWVVVKWGYRWKNGFAPAKAPVFNTKDIWYPHIYMLLVCAIPLRGQAQVVTHFFLHRNERPLVCACYTSWLAMPKIQGIGCSRVTNVVMHNQNSHSISNQKCENPRVIETKYFWDRRLHMPLLPAVCRASHWYTQNKTYLFLKRSACLLPFSSAKMPLYPGFNFCVELEGKCGDMSHTSCRPLSTNTKGIWYRSN